MQAASLLCSVNFDSLKQNQGSQDREGDLFNKFTFVDFPEFLKPFSRKIFWSEKVNKLCNF